MSDYYADLGQRIRAIRTMQGLSQGLLAARMGMPQALLSKVELGQRRLAVHELIPAARALGVAVDDLLAGSPVTTTSGSLS